MVETLVVVFLTLLILLGIIQFALIYNAKTTLTYATFEAARAGALNYADKTAIEYGLARGLSPLYTSISNASGTMEKVAAVQTARDRVYEEIRTREGENLGQFACIERINPPESAFDSHGIKDTTGLFDGEKVIPNDHLLYRSRLAKNDLSIQDANLLKLRVTYCYPMIVPVISSTIQQLTGVTGRKKTTVATGQSANNHNFGAIAPEGSFQEYCYSEGRFPIVAQAIVRMQTPIRNDPRFADDCQ